jgi:hypothetical protein
MEPVDVKIGILHSRANRLDRKARQKFAAILSRIDNARVVLELKSVQLLTSPRWLVASVVDEVSSCAESLDGQLRQAFRQLSRLQSH